MFSKLDFGHGEGPLKLRSNFENLQVSGTPASQNEVPGPVQVQDTSKSIGTMHHFTEFVKAFCDFGSEMIQIVKLTSSKFPSFWYLITFLCDADQICSVSKNASHLSKGLSDLKQECTQVTTPFLCTLFDALSLGELHFIWSVSFRNHFPVDGNFYSGPPQLATHRCSSFLVTK